MELRKLGWDISVISIRPDDRSPEQLTVAEREEASRTWVVIDQGIISGLLAHFSTALQRPLSYFRAIFYALKLGQDSPTGMLKNLIYLTEALLVGNCVDKQGFTHVHVHFASTVGLFLQRIFPITLSLTLHGPSEFEAPVAFHLEEKVEASSLICAISNFGRSQIMKASAPNDWHKIQVFPLGVDPAIFVPSDSSKSQGGVTSIICVATLTSVKGQQILIDAAEILIKGGSRLVLHLVGDGPNRSALTNHADSRGISESVRFEGALNQDQVRALCRECDLFVLPSFGEGVPVVLMEAMAMEIPCIATWVAGVPELIENRVSGLLVPPSDVDQLADAIQELINHPNERLRLAKAGRQQIVDKYNLSINVERLSSAFQNLQNNEKHGKSK
jgi:colanic acid/amylovoran biosynthesis glycosyltransferase